MARGCEPRRSWAHRASKNFQRRATRPPPCTSQAGASAGEEVQLTPGTSGCVLKTPTPPPPADYSRNSSDFSSWIQLRSYPLWYQIWYPTGACVSPSGQQAEIAGSQDFLHPRTNSSGIHVRYPGDSLRVGSQQRQQPAHLEKIGVEVGGGCRNRTSLRSSRNSGRSSQPLRPAHETRDCQKSSGFLLLFLLQHNSSELNHNPITTSSQYGRTLSLTIPLTVAEFRLQMSSQLYS